MTQWVASNGLDDPKWHVAVYYELTTPSGKVYVKGYKPACGAHLGSPYGHTVSGAPHSDNLCKRCAKHGGETP